MEDWWRTGGGPAEDRRRTGGGPVEDRWRTGGGPVSKVGTSVLVPSAPVPVLGSTGKTRLTTPVKYRLNCVLSCLHHTYIELTGDDDDVNMKIPIHYNDFQEEEEELAHN